MPAFKQPWPSLRTTHPLAQGLVGAWTLHEGSGLAVSDLSGNGNNGTVTGATWSAGQNGYQLNFSGTSQYVTVPSSASLNSLTSQISVAVLYTHSGTANGYLIGKVINTYSWYLHINQSEQAWDWLVDAAGSISLMSLPGGVGGLDPWLGIPVLVVGTYDGATQRLYVNGQLLGAQAVSGALATNADSLGIGSRGGDGNSPLTGAVTAAFLWNRALSAAEVSQLVQDPFKPVRRGQVVFKAASGITGAGPLRNLIVRPRIHPSVFE